MVTKVEQAVSGWPLTKRWWTIESRWNWRGMRLCAGGITDCEGGGLCQRYGWTGRRTARVAHKRAGRRLRLQSDLERFPDATEATAFPARSGGRCWWRHKETHPSGGHSAAAACIQTPFWTLLAHWPWNLQCGAVRCEQWCCTITTNAIGRSSWDGLLQAWGPGSAACLHACCLGVRQAGRCGSSGRFGSLECLVSREYPLHDLPRGVFALLSPPARRQWACAARATRAFAGT